MNIQYNLVVHLRNFSCQNSEKGQATVITASSFDRIVAGPSPVAANSCTMNLGQEEKHTILAWET